MRPSVLRILGGSVDTRPLNLVRARVLISTSRGSGCYAAADRLPRKDITYSWIHACAAPQLVKGRASTIDVHYGTKKQNMSSSYPTPGTTLHSKSQRHSERLSSEEKLVTYCHLLIF